MCYRKIWGADCTFMVLVCVCVSVCLPACLPVCLSVCLSVSMLACLSLFSLGLEVKQCFLCGPGGQAGVWHLFPCGFLRCQVWWPGWGGVHLQGADDYQAAGDLPQIRGTGTSSLLAQAFMYWTLDQVTFDMQLWRCVLIRCSAWTWTLQAARELLMYTSCTKKWCSYLDLPSPNCT